MHLNWVKCGDNGWCDLQKVDLSHEHFDNLDGVYVIWQTNVEDDNVVKVGQGNIRDRLQAHRVDEEIQRYNTGGLDVTWAEVAFQYRDGIERYIGNTLNPKVAQRLPDESPIEVNLPG